MAFRLSSRMLTKYDDKHAHAYKSRMKTKTKIWKIVNCLHSFPKRKQNRTEL